MIIDALIPDDLAHDADTFHKARILVTIIIIYSLIVSGIAIWIFSSADLSRSGKMVGILTMTGMQAGFVVAMLALRMKSWFGFAANFTVFLAAAGIVCGVLVSGGPMSAPAMSMNILPIIMAFVLAGKRTGLVWAQIILTIHVILLVAVAYGHEFIQMITPEMLPLQHLAHWLVTYSAMIGLMFATDAIKNRKQGSPADEMQRLEYLASHDPMTHLPNRMQFDINLSQSMSRSDRHKVMMAVFFIDLDKFHSINDELGREAGDLALEIISRRLENNLRKMDTIARLGGDEFGIILEDIRDPEKLPSIARKIHRNLAKPLHLKSMNKTAHITGSIGIAIYPLHTANKDDLVKFAEIAMGDAKAAKSEWHIYAEKPSLNDKDPAKQG